MSKEKEKSKGQKIKIEKERSEFNVIMATDPNYFGTVSTGALKPVKKEWSSNTKYEELTCVGYNPRLEMLEATIQLKLSYGYGGSDLCDSGSTEYVRFFLNYGSGWEDGGLAAVHVHDIVDSVDCAEKLIKPLNYVVTRPIEPKNDHCSNPVLPKVRAILSWNRMPSEDPDEPPIWGNVLERYVQIKPLPKWKVFHLVESIKNAADISDMLKLPKVIENAKYETIPLPDPPPLDLSELTSLYKSAKGKKMKVEPHRFGAKDLEAAVSQFTLAPEAQAAKMLEWENVGLSWKDAMVEYVKTKGNVTYEELHCLGLDCNRDWLVATFIIKKPCGYSGGLCDDGSREYITFWADWDDTCNWVHLDTNWIDVHDITSIPDEGLHYTVICPVDLSSFRQDCEDGPKIGRIRAVLSWNTPPSNTNPNTLPKWGNRLDAHVQIKPKSALTGSIAAIGGVGIKNINVFGNGKTKPGAKFAFFDLITDPWDPSRECPFGRRIQFHGVPAAGSEYRTMVRRVGESDFTVLKKGIWVTNSIGDSDYHQIKPNGYFDTLPQTANIGSLLAVWDSHREKADDKNALWEAMMEVRLSGGGVLFTPWYKIRLDNTSPSATIHIDSGGDCKDFIEGVTINGHFVARDYNFGHYNVRTLPKSLLPTNPVPHTDTVQTSPSPGNAWSLDTKDMEPCGYVVELKVWDRTIVGSMPHHHNYVRDDLGFCLRKKKK